MLSLSWRDAALLFCLEVSCVIREKIFGAFGPESCCSGAGVAGRQGKGQGRAGDSRGHLQGRGKQSCSWKPSRPVSHELGISEHHVSWGKHQHSFLLAAVPSWSVGSESCSAPGICAHGCSHESLRHQGSLHKEGWAAGRCC